MFKPHECGDTRLKCIDCDGPVCPKCFVQCPVGQRCKGCSSKFTSHVLNVGLRQLALMFVVALLLGGAFGFASGILRGGFFMWAIVYFLGVTAGNLIHKVVGFKIGPKVIAVATVAVLIGGGLGIRFSPMNLLVDASQAMHVEDAMKAQQYQQTAWSDWMEKGKSRSDAMLAAAKDEAQKRLPQLVAAKKRGDMCFVLVGEGPDANKVDWLYVTNATDAALLCTSATQQGASRTVAPDEVLDWTYYGKAGFEAAAKHAQTLQMVKNDDVQAQAKSAMAMMEVWSYLDLLIFLAGVITILSGQVPAFRFPFFRR